MAQTSLLLSLSHQDAAAIREKATKEDRTISAYVLRIVLKQVAAESRLRKPHPLLVPYTTTKFERERSFGPRTVLHIRCAPQQAAAIRQAARRQGTSISGFVLRSLRRWWRALQFSSVEETAEQRVGARASHLS